MAKPTLNAEKINQYTPCFTDTSTCPTPADFPITSPNLGIIDWRGLNDPDDPLNWPLWKRAYCSISIGLLSLAITFGSSVYAPGVPQIMEEFQVSSTVALLGLSLYVLSLALGPMIAAPLSETHGRVLVYRITIPISMLFTLGAGLSKTLTQLLVCRFLAGMTGAGVLAIGAGSGADMWHPKDRGLAIVPFLIGPFLGPALGPFVGGFTVMHKSWRWTQWDSLFVSLALYLLSIPLPESYKKIILRRRAKRMNNVMLPPAGPQGLEALKLLFQIVLARPLLMLVREHIVIFLSLYTAFTFAVLFGFFEAIPIIFTRTYHFDLSQCGLVFLAFAVGFTLAAITGVFADIFVYRAKLARAVRNGVATIPPEERLHVAMWGSIGIPIGLFWLAFTSRTDIHWASPIASAVPFAWGIFCVQISTVLYLVDVYGPLVGASAMAANGLLRYIAAAAFPLFIIRMYDALGKKWATSVFGFVGVLMLPIPWVLYRYGSGIRARSRYDAI